MGHSSFHRLTLSFSPSSSSFSFPFSLFSSLYHFSALIFCLLLSFFPATYIFSLPFLLHISFPFPSHLSSSHFFSSSSFSLPLFLSYLLLFPTFFLISRFPLSLSIRFQNCNSNTVITPEERDERKVKTFFHETKGVTKSRDTLSKRVKHFTQFYSYVTPFSINLYSY